MDHMPLLMVCLEGLGKLAQKFPNIAGTSISYLRDFLVDPSPILAKLYSLSEAQQKKDKESQPFKIVGECIEAIGFGCSMIDCVLAFFRSPRKRFTGSGCALETGWHHEIVAGRIRSIARRSY